MNSPEKGEDLRLESKSSEPETANPEQATYPGVVNRLLRKGGSGTPSISLYYPQFGVENVDNAMRRYVEEQAKDYEEEIAQVEAEDEKPASFDMWDMTGFFTLERPSPNVVSVLFNIYSYSGGAHGTLLLQNMNYNLQTGQKISFFDLFKDPDKAIEILSKLSAQKLHKELGPDADEEMIASGTTPEIANFSNLTLVPNGVFVEFQPYQVGPWSIGPQRVEITLAELAQAMPNMEIWPAAKELLGMNFADKKASDATSTQDQ